VSDRVCINAGDDANHKKRPAVAGGPRTPRCVTCQRAEDKRIRQRNKETRVEKVYGTSSEEYDAILAAQGGRCAICRCGPGRNRRFAVDHDHNHCGICRGTSTCGAAEAIRGLLCKRCNSTLLARFGLQTLIRACRYLISPPAPEILRRMRDKA
jgi:hypothetical protein